MAGSSVTLRDIAGAAGIHVSAVSKVLRGHGAALRISQNRQAKIHEIAARMGYRPNTAARATVRGRFDALGLLLSTHSHRSHLPAGLVDGIQAGCSEHNLHLHLAKLPDEKVTDEAFIPRILRELSVDGLLINYTSEIPERMLSLIDDFGIPSVWLNSKQDHDCVRPDDLEAGRRATEALLAAGHRRILYADLWPAWHYSNVDRREGYEQAMRAAGLEPRLLYRCVAYPERADVYRQVLDSPDRPTAIVAYGDASFIIAGAAKARICLPDELAVVAIAGDSALGSLMGQLVVPEAAMGQAAVDMLIQKIRGEVSDTPAQVISYGPIAGVVRPPANSSHANP